MLEIGNGWQAACVGLEMHIVGKRPASTGVKEKGSMLRSHRRYSGASLR